MSANSTVDQFDNLWSFINVLVDVDPTDWTEDEAPWFEPGYVYQIDEKTYWHYLELLPPRWVDGTWFAFGEGAGQFKLFWKMQDTYFVRELTEDETRTFCKLSRVSLHL